MKHFIYLRFKKLSVVLTVFIFISIPARDTCGDFFGDVAECLLGLDKPDDGQPKKTGEINIDAVFQQYDGSYLSAFGKKGVISIPKYHFGRSDISVDFSNSAYVYPDIKQTYTDNDFPTLWQNAHLLGASGYPAFVYSGREHITGCLGRTSRPGGLPGTQMNFHSEHIVFIAYRTIGFLEVRLPAIWGYTMTHELGHLYSNLTDADQTPEDHNSELCLMYDLSSQTDQRKLDLTNGAYFCQKCKVFLKQAIPQ